MRIFVIIGILFLKSSLANSDTAKIELNSNSSEHSEGISVVSLHIDKLETHITILIFILIVVILKMLYHHLHHILAYLPESCILIILGVLFGVVLKYGLPNSANSTRSWSLTSDLFFLYLLPPIILDAAFSITNKSFGGNLGVILVFAVLGTVLNFLIIGFVLYGLQYAGVMHFESLTLKRSLLYSSFIVAVDPVAVLAIFEDLGVNRDLYYMVFGESLLNDAVTIVLYQIMEAFSKTDDITVGKIGLGIAKFFTVSLGALSIGIVVGVICCQITRFTRSCRVYEPVIILATAYLSYILGDLFEWSGIISMIGCGCVQAGYAFHNISEKSVAVIRRIVKMIAHISEAVIFLYLGIETILSQFIWHTGFHLWSLASCLIGRGLVVIVLCFFINMSNIHKSKIQLIEQFVISYGGLRGAVAFSLAALIDANYVGGSEVRSIFISSTLFTIFFTVGVMGITMKPLAKLFDVKLLQTRGLSLVYEMNVNAIGHITAGIEEITGMKGANHLRDLLLRWDDKYLRKALMRDPETHDEKLVHTYEKICFALHKATVTRDNSDHYLNKLSGAYKNKITANFSSENIPQILKQDTQSSDNLNDLDTIHPNDEHVDVRRRRLSTKTDSDIIRMFSRARGNSISGGSFPNQLHEILDRRKRHVAQHRHFPKLHMPHVFSKHHLTVNNHNEQKNGGGSGRPRLNDNRDAIPGEERTYGSFRKLTEYESIHEDDETIKRHEQAVMGDDNSETRVRVSFEIPEDVNEEDIYTKL